MPAAPTSPWLARAVFALALLLGGWSRVHLALGDDGIYWPDEIYQSLEPAHRLVFGYGLVAWEFIRGARPWAFPGFVAALLELARGLGLSEPRGYLDLVRIVFSAIGLLSAWATVHLARRLGAEPLAAAAAGTAWALGAVFIYFAPRAMGEGVSALLVPLGLAESLPRDASSTRRGLGSALLGLSVWLRLHNALFCLALVLILAVRRNGRGLAISCSVLAVCALGLGLLDRWTWGGWFHSASEYLAFNLIEGKSDQWGTSGLTFYAGAIGRSMPALALVATPLCARGLWRSPALAGALGLFVLAHVAVPHKELRFLLPALPLACAAVGLGLGGLRPLLERGAVAALVLAAALSWARAGSLTFGDLGQYGGAKAYASAYDDFGPVNRLLIRASTFPDLCGIKVEGVHLAWVGGYSYLHRPVPLYGGNGPPRESRLYNHVITPLAWARGLSVLAEDGGFALVSLGDSCSPDAHFSWRLP